MHHNYSILRSFFLFWESNYWGCLIEDQEHAKIEVSLNVLDSVEQKKNRAVCLKEAVPFVL